MMIGLVSAKGAPGVTTAALALTVAAGEQGLLIEMDPSGGSLECWTGVAGEPGLMRVASGLRRSLDADVVAHGVLEVPVGVAAVLAPTSAPLAESTIAALGERLSIVLDDTERTVVLDAGRWCRSQSTSRRLSGCRHVLVVCSPTLAGIESARSIIDPLRVATDAAVSFLIVGDRPYQADEIAAATGVEVAGVLPWDSKAVNALLISGANRSWLRTGLARSARGVLNGLSARPVTVEGVAV